MEKLMQTLTGLFIIIIIFAACKKDPLGDDVAKYNDPNRVINFQNILLKAKYWKVTDKRDISKYKEGTTIVMDVYDYPYCQFDDSIVFTRSTQIPKLLNQYTFFNAPCNEKEKKQVIDSSIVIISSKTSLPHDEIQMLEFDSTSFTAFYTITELTDKQMILDKPILKHNAIYSEVKTRWTLKPIY